MERLSTRSMYAQAVISPEVARTLTELSLEIKRQIGLIIDRRGRITAVVVGDARALFLPDIHRRGRNRLSGLRLVHTHLTEEPLSQEDLTDLAVLRLDLISVITVRADGMPGLVHSAHLVPDNEAQIPWMLLPAQPVHELKEDFLDFVEALEEEFSRTQHQLATDDPRERAILIHVSTLPRSLAQDAVAELKELARSAGIQVVQEVLQRRPIDNRMVLGKGKMQSVLVAAMQKGAELLIFDTNLSPSQLRSLGDFTDLKILDRTQLILDIFAQHAVTREGKLQVELAQLRYLLPFLSIRQEALSRLTGGIGGRGPGETRLEVDRRRARDRIARLEREVEQLGKRRRLRRRVRTEKNVPTIAVVGYTNAGKSTLLNHLTNSDVTAKDFLFATLNPVSRRLRFPHEREIIITDTVGFIRELPADLLAAFRTTFEELDEADLLLHVVDAHSPDLSDKMETVLSTIRSLDLDHKPMVTVFNKIDLCSPEEVEGLLHQYEGIPVCALDRSSCTPLLTLLEDRLWPEDMNDHV